MVFSIYHCVTGLDVNWVRLRHCVTQSGENWLILDYRSAQKMTHFNPPSSPTFRSFLHWITLKFSNAIIQLKCCNLVPPICSPQFTVVLSTHTVYVNIVLATYVRLSKPMLKVSFPGIPYKSLYLRQWKEHIYFQSLTVQPLDKEHYVNSLKRESITYWEEYT